MLVLCGTIRSGFFGYSLLFIYQPYQPGIRQVFEVIHYRSLVPMASLRLEMLVLMLGAIRQKQFQFMAGNDGSICLMYTTSTSKEYSYFHQFSQIRANFLCGG